MAVTKGKGRKLGRNLIKCKKYRDNHTKEKNKVKRILKSNGVDAAKIYAAKNGISEFLKKLLPLE